MTPITGKLRVVIAESRDQIAQAMSLRQARFGVGADAFDQGAMQVMIAGSALECTFRLTVYPDGAAAAASYSAQFYDLGNLARIARPIVELGRFCLIEGAAPDVLRLAFAAMTQVVDRHGAALLFGCASFAGAGVEVHRAGLDILPNHFAPPFMSIGKKSPQVIDLRLLNPNVTPEGLRQIPPLLRSYLALGGWVSDHAVQDFDLNTLHVFTGVEIEKIPAARAAGLRSLVDKIGFERIGFERNGAGDDSA